jgi:DNA repair protein RadC
LQFFFVKPGNFVEALALIDVRVLDHLVVATSGTVSLAERGE